GAWTPGTGGTGTQALWTLTGTAGRIIANGFNFSSARVDSSVGPGLILESRAGNGVANTLSTGTGSGTIDPTSVFRYAGAAAVATPSTLTSTRAIGILEVTSGALQVSSLPGLAAARVNGGVLIATSSNALPGFGSAGFVTFGGGTLQLPVDGTAWTMSQVDTLLTNATKTSGALAIDVASGVQTQTGSGYSGGIGLTKLGAGTLVLSAANTYTGASTVSAGTLQLDDASALGNTANALAVNGGSLNLNGNSVSVGTLSGSSGATISTNSSAGTATLSTSVSGSSTFGGVIQDNGSGRLALTKLGSGTLALSAVNTYTGTTSVNAGVLQVGVSGGAGRVTGDTAVNTGGRLLLTNVSGTLGNVTLAGGRMDLSTNNASIGALSMTSGTLGLGNSTLRLSVWGNASVTGGSVVEPGSAGVISFYGTTNVFAPETFSTAYSFQLLASGNQTFSGSTALGAFNLRGTGIKTVSNSGTITTISFINDTAGSPVTLKLGSNIAVGTGGLNLAGFSQQGTALSFGVDADTYSLNLTAASGAWTPGTGGTGTTALWTLTGTAGRIIANGFNLSSARVDSSVGPGLILESRAGDGGTNNLSVGTGSGTIDPASVFRYAGSAVAATPATLTSSRAIGDLEVTSGALRITSLAGLQNLRVTGGTLDLGNQSLSVTSGSFGGGSVTSGTLTSSTFLATSGTVGASLAGVGGTLTKSGAGTFTLAGANTYTGATTVSAGTLLVNGDQSAAVGAVTVAAGATLGGSGVIGGAVSILGGGMVAPGTSPGTLTLGDSLTLAGTSILSFELDAQNATVGGGVNDLITGVTALTLDGVLDIAGTGDWTAVADNTTWRLVNYSGSLFDNGLTLGSVPTLGAGQSFQIDTGTAGQVNLVVVPEPTALAVAGIGLAAAAAILRRRRK
ncbi:MAG: beta strand repeat-containing protein, partial [Planctomycetota bacterium]